MRKIRNNYVQFGAETLCEELYVGALGFLAKMFICYCDWLLTDAKMLQAVAREAYLKEFGSHTRSRTNNYLKLQKENRSLHLEPSFLRREEITIIFTTITTTIIAIITNITIKTSISSSISILENDSL